MKQCSTSCVLRNCKDEYLAWLVGLLGPVLMGSKPAEIISFPKYDENIDKKINMIKMHFKVCKKIRLEVVKAKDDSIKIIFYNPESLNRCLSGYRNKRFLYSLGYPMTFTLEEYIEAIVCKIAEGEMPHEIGVFLGYPLKDIIGFLGHPSLTLTKVNGWRVYGNPKISDEKYQEFLMDRQYVSDLLEVNEPEEILYMM